MSPLAISSPVYVQLHRIKLGPALFPAGRVPNGEAYLDQASTRFGGILSVVI